MGVWIDALESKVRIVHEQMAAARALATSSATDVEFISKPYLELLRRLYEEEFQFAQLADSSDLIARFTGPAVSHHDPSVTLVTGVFTDLRNQVRNIAKSIVGLSVDSGRLRWPTTLDPYLNGLAHGSLIVGISVPHPDSEHASQQALPGFTDQLYDSVRTAVRSIASVARYIGVDTLDDDIRAEFPDPAIRDTVMVAASRLAPTGRRGIDAVTFLGEDEKAGSAGAPLTLQSRKILLHALERPVRISQTGDFTGVVREIDLDAHRFELRRVAGAGAIRCIYDPTKHEQVRQILDAQIRVKGRFETERGAQPRLVEVDSIELLRSPSEQRLIDFEEAEK